MSRLDDLKYEVNCAVLEAIDSVLVAKYGIAAMVRDHDLPSILPHIERLTVKRLEAVYENLPVVLEHHADLTDKLAMKMLGVPL